jgi:diguanylate cyclase (GGDEF)-like protein
MRPSALLGLVVSLLLGAIAVSVTLDSEHARRSEQDRALQAAAGSEIALISDGERQTSDALSQLFVDPAVRELISGTPPSGGARREDLANSALALSAIERSSFAPLSAACLDDASGRQLVCAPMARPVAFPTLLGREFAALAQRSSAASASGLFISPASGELSVAFLGPLIVRGQLRGLVHLDISVAATRGGGSLLVNSTPDVQVQLASYAGGLLLLDSTSAQLTAAGIRSQASLSPGFAVGPHPRSTTNSGHRAMVATLPLTIAGAQHVAVVATATAANPSFFNSWSSGMVAVMALALLMLIGAIAGLVASGRWVSRELTTDPLTGLRNRRALMLELPRVFEWASEDRPVFLWFFDLNGFKQYNDSFGHVSGDALLARLGEQLREVIAPYGRAYRLGGDEFCVLISTPVSDPHGLFQDARESLVDQGGAFTISASAGAVELPCEADSPTQALRLADQRMYREKAMSRGGGAELITSVLHAALAQRHPDLGEHSNDVAGDVKMLARRVGLDEDAISLIVRAGDLHDIGKLGIPDEILAKAGPLSEQEWEFMKRHTVIGEQIIAAAGPSLEQIAPLVRASHERWDGTGYPDHLKGEEIPLGARIITICDSFRAMIDDRVYKQAMSIEEALAELRRCAGTQFDPQLVEVFVRLVTERLARDRTSGSPATRR